MSISGVQLTNPQAFARLNQTNKQIPSKAEVKWALAQEEKVKNGGTVTNQDVQKYTDIANRLEATNTTAKEILADEDKFSLGEALQKSGKVALPVLAGFGAGSLMGMANIVGAASGAAYLKGVAVIGGIPGAVGAGTSMLVKGDESKKVGSGAAAGAVVGIAIGVLSKNPAAAIVTGLIGGAAGGFGAFAATNIFDK